MRPLSAKQKSASSPAGARQAITSAQNRWVKEFRAALRHGPSPDSPFIAVEGPHLVAEALQTGLEMPALVVSADAKSRLAPLLKDVSRFSPPTHILTVPSRLFDSLADTQSPQGIAALVRPPTATFDDLLRGGVPLVVVLMAVQDPGNVGTIIRAAEGFGATGIAATRGTAQPFSPKAMRASAGSAFRLPVLSGVAVPILLSQCRAAGLRLCATSSHVDGSIRSQDADFRAPTAILVGREGAGLPTEIQQAADVRVHIPLAAGVESLNAAVAAAVLLYEAASQRSSRS